MRKRTVRILTGVAVLIVVLALVYGIAVAVATVRLRRAYAALERDGRPMRAADVIPAEVPATENAALLYASAALLLEAQPAPDGESLRGYLASLSVTVVDKPGDPNAGPELQRLFERDAVSRALATIREASRRPSCRFDHDYEGVGLWIMPHWAELRDLVRILAGKACLEARAGESESAWDTVQSQLAASDALRTEPVLMSQLVRMATTRLTCRVIRNLCDMTPPDDQTYQNIEQRLRDREDIQPLLLAADGERLLVGQWVFNLSRAELAGEWRKLWDTGSYAPGVFHWAMVRIVTFKPNFLADHAAYMRYSRETAQLLAGRKRWDGRLDRIPKRYVLTRTLTPAVARLKAIHGGTIAEARITRAGLALLRYKQAHGSLPASLAALDLEGVADPFTGGPLHYRVEGDGFVLYSVGEDQKNNGGSPKQRGQRTDFDIAWQFPGGRSL